MLSSGPQTICIQWLKAALSHYVIFDGHKFESSLLSSGRNVTLEDVQLIERKIPLVRRRDTTTFITISGTVSRLSFEWQWTSLLLLEYSCIEIRGIKMTAVLSEEDTVIPDRREEDETPSTKEVEVKNLNGFFTLLPLLSMGRKEYGRFMKSLGEIIPSSEILRRALYHFTNSLSLKVVDVELKIVYEKGSQISDDQSRYSSVLGLERFEFVPTSGANLRHSTSPAVENIRFVHLGIRSLYFNVVDGLVSLPVLEPFTYSAVIRRVHGVRFVDLLFGYEIMGKDSSETDATSEFSQSHGMTVHLGATRIGAITTACRVFFSTSTETASTKKAKATTERRITRTFSKIAMFLLGVIILLSCWWAYDLLIVAINVGIGESHAIWLRVTSISYRLLKVGSLLVVVRWATTLIRVLSKPGSMSWKDATNKTSLSSSPAVFRMPLTYLRIVDPTNQAIDFINLSFMGRLDGTVVNVFANSLNVVGQNPSTGLRMDVNGIRAVVNNNGAFLNIDSIDDLFVPQTISLARPIRGTVVRFQDGKILVKVKSVIGTKIDFAQTGGSNTIASSQNSTSMERQNEPAKEPTREVDKDMIRLQINSDITAERNKLAIIARMFEGIPVKTITKNLRLYKRAFRGSEGVDYLLDLNIASNREEAVQIGRSLQSEFNLFEDVKRDFFAFQDDQCTLYQFVEEGKRRAWEEKFSSAVEAAGTVQNYPDNVKLVPFPVTIKIARMTLYEENGDWLITLLSTYVTVKPAILVGAVDVVVSVDSVENKMLLVTNARVQAICHPDLPREIHKLRCSSDSVRATGGFSAESWLHSLGFIGDSDSIKGRRRKKDRFRRRKKDKNVQPKAPETKAPSGAFALPNVYLSPFTLKLVFQSAIAQARESRIRIDAFVGTERTTSNDLILYFVLVVLGRTPGMVTNVDVLGMNVSDLTGIGTGMFMGVKFIPGGHFIGLGVIVGYDIIKGALDAGKKSRGKPDDRYRAGDFLRGAAFAVKEAARKGALFR